MPPSEIRKEAREALKGKWGKANCILLAYTLIYYLLDFVGIFAIVLTVPISFGLVISFIKLKRNEKIKAWDFLENGFSRFGKSWGIYWHTFIRMLLPIICLISTIILVFTLFLHKVNSMGLILLSVFFYIASIVYIISRSLLYTLAYNISYDKPELSSKECVNYSEKLMKGNRGNYLLLQLSFVGWFFILTISLILCCYLMSLFEQVNLIILILIFILSLLIYICGALYLSSYINVSTVCFYDKLIATNTKNINKEIKEN